MHLSVMMICGDYLSSATSTPISLVRRQLGLHVGAAAGELNPKQVQFCSFIACGPCRAALSYFMCDVRQSD